MKEQHIEIISIVQIYIANPRPRSRGRWQMMVANIREVGLKKPIAAVNPKPFDVLLCTSIDRIARDTDLVIRIHKGLKAFGVEIHFTEHGDIPA